MCAGLLVLPFVGWLVFAPRSNGPPVKRFSPTKSEPTAAAHAPSEHHDDRPAKAATSAPRAMEASVEGTVVGPDDKPLGEASVQCKIGDRTLDASPDDAGRFRFTSTAHGCKASATKRGFATSAEVELHTGSNNRLQLTPACGIAGTVVDPGGAPIATFWIGVESYEAPGAVDAGVSPRPAAMEVNDVGGNFQLEDLAAGRYVLLASIPDYPLARSAPVDVGAGSVTRDVKIVVKPGGTVIGKVFDAKTKKPVGAAMVFVDAAATNGLRSGVSVSELSGEFTFAGACPDGCSLRVVHPLYAAAVIPDVRAPAGGAPVRIEVPLSRWGETPP